MKSRLLTAIVFGVLMLIYFLIFAAAKTPAHDSLSQVLQLTYLVAVGVIAPSAIAGLIMGKYVVHGKACVSRKTFMTC